MVDNDVWGAAAHIRTADRWHSSAANWNSALTQALLDSANLHQTCLVVDVAAGSGDPALSIAQRLREGRVVAIDSSRPGLLLAKRQGIATEIAVGFGGHGGRGSIDKMMMGKSTMTPSPDGFSLGPGSVRHFPTGRLGNGTIDEVFSGTWTDTYEVEVGYRDIFNRAHVVTDCLVFHRFKEHDFEPCPFFHHHD
jgi:hypothetical protein